MFDMDNMDIVKRLIEMDMLKSEKYNLASDIGIELDQFLGEIDLFPLIADIAGHPLPLLAEWVESIKNRTATMDEVIDWIFDKEISKEIVEKYGE